MIFYIFSAVLFLAGIALIAKYIIDMQEARANPYLAGQSAEELYNKNKFKQQARECLTFGCGLLALALCSLLWPKTTMLLLAVVIFLVWVS